MVTCSSLVMIILILGDNVQKSLILGDNVQKSKTNKQKNELLRLSKQWQANTKRLLAKSVAVAFACFRSVLRILGTTLSSQRMTATSIPCDSRIQGNNMSI